MVITGDASPPAQRLPSRRAGHHRPPRGSGTGPAHVPPVAVAPALPRPARDAAAGHPVDGRPVRRRRDARRGAGRPREAPRGGLADDGRRPRRGRRVDRRRGSGRRRVPRGPRCARRPRPRSQRQRQAEPDGPRRRPGARAGRTSSGSSAAPRTTSAFVRIDMEDHATTDATLALWRELRPVNAGRGDSGVVIQAALRRSPADVDAPDRARTPGSGCARAPMSSRRPSPTRTRRRSTRPTPR